MAPRRKLDPGELFDWRRLADAGIGLWPRDAGSGSLDADSVEPLLAEYGYETEDLSRTVAAFQRHFRPERVDGVVDDETLGRLNGLLSIAGLDKEASEILGQVMDRGP